MPAWPDDLPRPVNASLVVAPRDNLTRFAGDVGAAITRRRSTARLVDYSAQLYLTSVERAALDAFYSHDCKDGSLSFTMYDWIGGLPCTMQWESPPTYSQAGPSAKWFASVSFVRLP